MISAGGGGLAADTPEPPESNASFRDFQMVSPMDSVEPERDDVLRRFVDKNDDKTEEEDLHEESVEDAAPHRVFVKSSRKDATETQHPFIVNPDNSYKEFSDYTRRRKRRRHSLARRILAPLVLLLAVSGAAWLLLGGMRPVPKPVPPAVIVDPIPEPEPVVVTPEPTIWEKIQIEDPSRGVVIGTNVNIRQTHSINGQIVAKLNAGARGDILGRWVGVSGALSGPWFNIRADGKDGWIYGQYFQPLDGRQATLPMGYTEALLKSFGSNKAELTAQLGLPTRQTPTTMTWTGLTIELRGDTNMVRMSVTGAQHVLENEVAVGVTEEALYKKVGYPSDYKAGQLRYIENGGVSPEQGMAVRMQNGKVQSITVGNI